MEAMVWGLPMLRQYCPNQLLMAVLTAFDDVVKRDELLACPGPPWAALFCSGWVVQCTAAAGSHHHRALLDAAQACWQWRCRVLELGVQFDAQGTAGSSWPDFCHEDPAVP